MTTKIHEEGEGGAAPGGACSTSSVGNTPGTDTGWGVNPPKKKIARRKVSMKEFLEINSSQVTESDATHIMTHDVMHHSGILARGTVLQKVHGSKKLYRVLAGRHAETIKSIDPEHVKPITEQELEEAYVASPGSPKSGSIEDAIAYHKAKHADGMKSYKSHIKSGDQRSANHAYDVADAHKKKAAYLTKQKSRGNYSAHLKEHELEEAIKGWKNAHSDLMKHRADASAASNSVVLHQLRADGKESGMHDARKSFRSDDEARAHVENIKKLNPTRKYRYNKYVNGQHVGIVESEETEMSAVQEFFGIKSFDDVLCEGRKLTHIQVRPNSNTHPDHLGKIGQFGDKMDLSDDDQYNKAVADAHAYGKEKYGEGKYELSHVDMRGGQNYAIRAGSVQKVRREMKKALSESSQITEASEYSFLSKSGFKKKGTVSDGGVVHSHPLHGDVIISKHGHWHHVPHGSTREDGFEGTTGNSLKDHLSRLSESELHRAVSSGMKDLLHSGDHATFKKVAAHLGHPEWQTNPSESDLKSCSTPKLQKAHDHMYKGHPLGESVDMISEVEGVRRVKTGELNDHLDMLANVRESEDLAEASSDDINREYDALKKHDIKTLRGLIKQQHRIIDTSEFRTKDHAISHYLRTKYGNKRVAAAFGLSESEVNEVEVQGADRYEYTHGKKPKGYGNWYFSKHKSIDFSKHKESEDHIVVRGTYGDAKKQAVKWANEKGHAVVHVQT